jgi:hypothetical protein
VLLTRQHQIFSYRHSTYSTTSSQRPTPRGTHQHPFPQLIARARAQRTLHRSAVVHSAAIVAAGARLGSAEYARCSAAHPPPPPPLLLVLPPILALALILLGPALPLALLTRANAAAGAIAAVADGDVVRGGSVGGAADSFSSDVGTAALLLLLLAFEFAAAESDSETMARRGARTRWSLAPPPPPVNARGEADEKDATDACGAAALMLLVEKRRRKVETAAALPGVETEREGSRSADSVTLEPSEYNKEKT